MSLSTQSARPLACLKQALRQCRAERQHQQTRSYAAAATQVVQYPSLQTRYPAPSKGFRTSQATKQNRKEATS
jgi:large subunit ribosomal protein L19